MDHGAIIAEAIGYAKEAFIGKWIRWMIFVICGLPMALFPFVFDVKKIADGTTFRWDLILWTELIILCIIAFFLSFIISGYMARVYRGISPAPDFDNWGTLYVDGIKLAVTGFLWFLPLMVVVAALLSVIFFGRATGSTTPSALIVCLIFLLIIIEIVLCIITILFSMMGVVRFARTGSIREGIRFTAIKETIRTIGWANYLIAFIILLVVGFAFFIIMSIITIIPYVGWVVQLALIPFYSVFTARYLSRVYDHGMLKDAA